MAKDLSCVIAEYVAAYVHANGASKAEHLEIERGGGGWLIVTSEGGYRSKYRKSDLELMTKRLLERPPFTAGDENEQILRFIVSPGDETQSS